MNAELEGVVTTLEHVAVAEGITLPTKAEAEREAAEIALTWATTFGATFAVLAKPALDAGSLGAEKAILVSAAIAGATAAARACKPLILKAIRATRKPATVEPATPAPAPTNQA